MAGVGENWNKPLGVGWPGHTHAIPTQTPPIETAAVHELKRHPQAPMKRRADIDSERRFADRVAVLSCGGRDMRHKAGATDAIALFADFMTPKVSILTLPRDMLVNEYDRTASS